MLSRFEIEVTIIKLHIGYIISQNHARNNFYNDSVDVQQSFPLRIALVEHAQNYPYEMFRRTLQHSLKCIIGQYICTRQIIRT